MLLRLTVLRYQNHSPKVPQSYIFSSAGGSIGRERTNQLVLIDEARTISRTQAQIRFQDGLFHLCNVGSNAVQVNGLRIIKNQIRVLHDGDTLDIGEYTLRAKRLGIGHEASDSDDEAHQETRTDMMNFESDDDFQMDIASALLTTAPMPIEQHAAALNALINGLNLNLLDIPAQLSEKQLATLGQQLHHTVQQALRQALK